MRKVYSIWVCAHPGPGFEGTVSRFRLEQSDIKGEPVYGRDQYDLLEVIMICLDEGSRHGGGDAVEMLGTLFDAHLTADEKIAALGDKFGIIVDEHFEGEVREMCNLSEGVFAVGIEQGIISSVRALMRTMGLTIEQALDALEIPGERRSAISEELADEA